MKKFMSVLFSGIATLVLSGCGGGSSSEAAYDTYFITDSFGDGVEGIIYYCDSGIQGTTDFDGAFDFDVDGDTCDFDFIPNNIVGDLYLESDADPTTDAGINGVDFYCIGYDINPDNSGVTGLDGYIEDVSLYTECTLYNL